MSSTSSDAPTAKGFARALPALALLAVVSMLASHAFTWFSVQRAADAADRGEVEAVARAIDESFKKLGRRPSRADLAAALDSYAERGVVYIAIDGHGGFESAGTPVDDGPAELGLTRHGEYLRAVLEPLPPPDRPRAPKARPAAPKDRPPSEDPPPAFEDRPHPAADRPADSEDPSPAFEDQPPASEDQPPAFEDQPTAFVDRPHPSKARPHPSKGRPHPFEGRPPGTKGRPPRPGHPRSGPKLVIDARPTLGARLHEDARVTGIAAVLASALFIALAFALRRSQLAHDRAMIHRARERRLAALGEMASVLTHEIRNPLASLKGHAQLLGEILTADDAASAKVNRIVSETERLERLTTDLLDFVGTGSLRVEAVDPVALVRSAAEGIPNLTLELRADDAPSAVDLDEARIHQVLLNLMKNAAQAAPDLPVAVEVKTVGKDLAIAVHDKGPGLPPGQEDRLFDPFFTTRTQGTGLGLSIARLIVERHGGSLSAANAPRGGAIFTMTVPLRSEKS